VSFGSEPATEAELLRRSHALAGQTVGHLAGLAGVPLPAELHRAKGLVGRLVEGALGAGAGSRPGPDLPNLGVEIKTVPVDRRGRPRESTFVCHLPLRAIATLDWEDSPVRAKLRRVLWVPIEHDGAVPLAHRRVGTAVLWAPNPQDLATLVADWEELAGRIGAHDDVQAITAHVGTALQVRPKGNSAREGRHAFYLRPWFTGAILLRALNPGVEAR
jgi:DNA mismatch repair protein MutH